MMIFDENEGYKHKKRRGGQKGAKMGSQMVKNGQKWSKSHFFAKNRGKPPVFVVFGVFVKNRRLEPIQRSKKCRVLVLPDFRLNFWGGKMRFGGV
jgi:hypothetical protein